MRILRLELGNDVGAIDLHPLVTVLQGLDEAARQRLVSAVQALVQGRDPGVGGLVENQGLLIGLTPGVDTRVGALGLDDVHLDADLLPVDTHDQLPGLWARFDQVSRQADIDVARLEEVRTQLDPMAAAVLHRLQADQAAKGADEPSSDADARAAVAAALAAWAATAVTVRVAPTWVTELSRQWDEHRRRGAACEARLATLNRHVEAASRRLAAAVAALDEVEAGAVPVLLTAEDEARLEELATRPVTRSRLRGLKGRSEEEQGEIDELLARAGQPTYAAYVMFRMAPTAPPEHLAGIDAARAVVTAAETDLAAATRARDEDRELAVHRARRDALRAVAAEHLGPLLPDDLHQVLGNQGEQRPNPERAAARRNLVAVASRHGLGCPEDGDDDELARHVERWLTAGHPDAPDVEAEVDLGALQRRVARHLGALDQIDVLERRAEHSRRLVEELESRIAGVGRPPSPSAGAIVAAVDRLAAEATSASAGSRAGAVPLVLSGSLLDLPPGAVWELLDRLELEVERVQLLVVTDHAEAGRWADEAGLRRALRATGPVGRK